MGSGILPRGWHPVDFTIELHMASTFVGRLSAGGWRMDFSYVDMNRWWMDLP